jgi:hypothetical protein
MALAAGEKDGGEGRVSSWASSARCSKTRSKTLEDHFVENQRISALADVSREESRKESLEAPGERKEAVFREVQNISKKMFTRYKDKDMSKGVRRLQAGDKGLEKSPDYICAAVPPTGNMIIRGDAARN